MDMKHYENAYSRFTTIIVKELLLKFDLKGRVHLYSLLVFKLINNDKSDFPESRSISIELIQISFCLCLSVCLTLPFILSFIHTHLRACIHMYKDT